MSGSTANPHIITLCQLAQADESTLVLPLPEQIFGFHAQQSCEKLLKALIAAHGIAYPLTHNLERLIDSLKDTGEQVPQTPFDLLLLQPFAVEFRYDFGGDITEEEKAAIRESVATLRVYVLERIEALTQPTP